MTDTRLERAIDDVGRERVFALVRAAGWPSGSTPPKWIWEEAVWYLRHDADTHLIAPTHWPSYGQLDNNTSKDAHTRQGYEAGLEAAARIVGSKIVRTGSGEIASYEGNAELLEAIDEIRALKDQGGEDG